MIRIKAFKAVRPGKDLAESIAALPYDVYSEKEARDIVKKNPLSFLKIVRPETVFEENTDIYSDKVYKKAAEILQDEIEKGNLCEEDTESLYVYRQTMNGRAQTGLVACFSVDDYLENRIKRHEFTRKDKEDDRTKHIDVCSAQTGLVFLAYDGSDSVERIIYDATLNEPLYDFISEDGVRQQVWKISDRSLISDLSAAFCDVESMYIADGHHRCQSSATVAVKRRSEADKAVHENESDYFLAVAFAKEQLLIYPYNRVISDLNGLSREAFMDAVKNAGFTVSEVSVSFTEEERRRGVYKTAKKGEIAMYLDKKWYRLTASEAMLNGSAVESLDVSILQDNILDKILGITDPRTDKRIDFVGGIKGMAELERRCSEDMMLAFALYPTSMDELIRVTDEGKVMPPKSTWFEPKLMSGLFVHMI